jgi:hypothetical protein
MSNFTSNAELLAAFKAALITDGASESEATAEVTKLDAELKMRGLRNPQRVIGNIHVVTGLSHGDMTVLKEVLQISDMPSSKKEEGKEDKGGGDKPKALTPKIVNAMNLRQLIEHYDPREANLVASRLEEASRGNQFLVFEDEDNMIVNVGVSCALLEEIRNNEEPRQHYTADNGEVHGVFKVGVRPTKPLADVNPLFPEGFLRGDQSCTFTDQKWAGVTHDVRVLFHLAVKKGELRVAKSDRMAVKNFIDMGKKPGALADISSLYPAARLEFSELKKISQLPTLKGVRGEKKVEEVKKVEVEEEKVGEPLSPHDPSLGVPIFILAATKDAGSVADLKAHLYMSVKSKAICIYTKDSGMAGDDAETAMRRMQQARVVVLMVSSHLFPEHDAEVDQVLALYKAGKTRVIPVLLVDFKLADSSLADFVALPRKDGPVAKWKDKDSAWAHVVAELRTVWESVSGKKRQ